MKFFKIVLKFLLKFFKKQFTVEKIMNKYADQIIEVVMDRIEDAIADQQKGKLVASDVSVSHIVKEIDGKTMHIFCVTLEIDKRKLIELLMAKNVQSRR